MFKTPIGQHGKHISLKNLKKSWSKWGNLKLGFQKRTPEWICQVCGDLQPEALDPFLFPMSDREFLRICAKCENKHIVYEITTHEVLIMICRKHES